MKKNYIRYILLWVMTICMGLTNIHAQVERPPVLMLNGGNGYTTHFDTKTQLTSELLNGGIDRQATIEFWVMGSKGPEDPDETYEPWRLSNLKKGSDEFTVMGSRDQLQLTIGNAVIPDIELAASSRLEDNEWHHIALTFAPGAMQTQQSLRIYIDGIQQTVMQYEASIQPEYLYFTIAAHDQLSIAEFRAWNRRRTQLQIEENRFRSFFNENATNLNTLANAGLVIAYVDNSFVEAPLNNLPQLEATTWTNRMTLVTNPVIQTQSARVSSRVFGTSGVRLAELTTMADHPIFGLDDVLLQATDGNGADFTAVSGGRDGITLRWPHLRDITSYTISRRDLADPNSLPSRIETKEVAADFPISTFVSFFDDKVLPNELYEYTVTPNQGGNPGIDNGLVFANGVVEGEIQTPLSVATQNALVTAVPESGDTPGSALEFRPNTSTPIGINDVTIFEQAAGRGTIEFWYRTPSSNAGENTVFKLDVGEIRITNTTISVQSLNPTNPENTITYLTTTKPDDTDWHHYALTFSPDGGALYIDGGIAPTNGAREFTANVTTTNPFVVGLNRSSQFSFNAAVNNTYQLDEIRIWKGRRSTIEIGRYKNLIITGEEENLLAYYRFDLPDATTIYNQAFTTRGRLSGSSINNLIRLSSSDQAPITYGAYTDMDGRYEITTINAGRQGNGLSYRITPSRPNSDFMPENVIREIERSLTPEDKQANFTDNSALPISGRIVYRVPDTDNPAELFDIPSLQGTGIEVNGNLVTSTDPNAQVRTNADGVYVITATPGRRTIRVAQNIISDLDDDNTNADKISLDFDGTTGYVESSSNIVLNDTDSFTWSGFVLPDLIEEGIGETFNPIQTILHWGALRLELRNNEHVYLVINDTDILNATIERNSRYAFFAISADPNTNTVALKVNNNYRTALYNGLMINDKVYLGAQNVGTGTEPRINFSRANMDILEYRTDAYSPGILEDIRNGEVLTDDDALTLSYSFEHERGERAVNLAVNEGSGDNEFLILQGGAFFDNMSTSGYFRRFEYSYRAIGKDAVAPLIDPTNDSQYVFDVIEAVSSVNFENTTRRSFVGNIVVPCNYGVGEWTGTITRTDIAFPTYERVIDRSNFNGENTVFEVHDLVPGQYTVSLTNEDTGRQVQSPILDLRRGNLSYDFQFRNPIEVETTFYQLREGELAQIIGGTLMMTQAQLDERLVTASCSDDDGVIYTTPAGVGMIFTINVFERYGSNVCPVEGAAVAIGGSMLSGNLSMDSNDLGFANFATTTTNIPNFIAPYLNSLTVAVSHEGRNKNANERAYVTGSQRGNNDFTLIDPTIGYVLHDPPGDGSSTTISEGATYTYSKTVEGGFDTATSVVGMPAGISLETSQINLAVVAPAGAGLATGVSSRFVESETGFSIGGNINSTYRRTTGNGNSVSVSRSISTPTFDTYVGQDADVFIGTSQVLTFGTGRTLTVTNCTVDIDTDRMAMTADEATPFAFTRQQIEDDIIPDLQRLFIERHDELFPPAAESVAARNTIDLQLTIDGFNFDPSPADADEDLVRYFIEAQRWQEIVKRPSRAEFLDQFNRGATFEDTTNNLRPGEAGNVPDIDSEFSFSSGTTITYELTRSVNNSEQNSGNVSGGVDTQFTTRHNILGATVGLTTSLSISGVVGGSDGTENENTRVDSITLTDDDAGDNFNVRIRRDPVYDTPMFFTAAGDSRCPFESGTVPIDGVQLVVDKTVGFGTGDESILYTLTLRNTRRSDALNTNNRYFVGINAASNNEGAQIFLNESPIFEPTTRSEFVFGPDPSSPTGYTQEITAQLRIARGLDAPENISYKDLGIQIFSECERGVYQAYRVDEYEEVGVVPFHEIFLTAHFSGACINEIEADLPTDDWVVNGSDDNELDFRFRIPEVVNDEIDDDFKVLLEYAIPGNNNSFVLKELTLNQLKEHMDRRGTGFVEYTADVSALVDGMYRFRITPFCDDGGSNIPSSRTNPTAYVTGTITRSAPNVVSTTPTSGGILESGQISATFSSAINPVTVNSSTVSLRGILGGVPAELKSGEFAEISDEVTIPHQPEFNITEAFTIEMWVNPSRFPNTGTVPILKKGGNYKVELTSEGRIRVNDQVTSTVSLSSLEWTHVAVVYDGVNTITVYYNGASVGSGNFTTGLVTNSEPIQIAGVSNEDSYVGLLDEVRIWTELRSPLEIVTNMDRQLVGNEVNFMAYFVFDDNALEGEDGAPDEAIRDFTGHAIGTTATGLTFVTGEGVAAPLDITRMVQDLQFNIEVSNNDTTVNIIPVFTPQEIEGASLTAMITNRVEDPSGNRVRGASWDFVVNRNTLAWSQNNIRIRQEQGTSSRVTTIDLDNSEGGVAITYRFANLPAWLSVEQRNGTGTTEIQAGNTQRIEALQVERDLEFVVAPFLNPGIHTTNVFIETFNATTGLPLGTEVFQLEVDVFCTAPAYSSGFNSGLFRGNMSFTGELFIEGRGIQSMDEGDIVAAYLNSEFRGSANVDSNGLVNLAVFGNTGESGNLSFRIWDASECTEYEGIVEEYPYSFRGRFGSRIIPISFTVGERLSRRIPIVPGFQELSFNVRDNASSNKLSITSITGLVSGDEISDAVDESIIATVDSDGTYIFTDPNTTSLDVRKAYTIRSTQTSNSMIQIQGIPVPVDTNIAIAGSNVFNGIGYLPNELLRVPVALRSLTSATTMTTTTISEGDRIERRGLSAEYTEDDGWVGNLTHLTPGLGYLYTATNDGILNYSGVASNSASAARQANSNGEVEISYLDKAHILGWEMNPNAYARFMYMTAVVDAAQLDASREYTIAAFIGDEVRGVAKPQLIDGQYHYFMGIGANESAEVIFKLFDGEKVVTLDNEEAFDHTVLLGAMKAPYVLSYTPDNEAEEVVLNGVLGLSLGQNIPNPMTDATQISYSIPEDGHVDISLYNVLGQKLYTFVSDTVKGNVLHTVDWNGITEEHVLSSGIYVYKLNYEGQELQRKLVIE
ncbi:LamG-like jellyroll fold domain-containing protein [Aquimarina rhabdastrellae]